MKKLIPFKFFRTEITNFKDEIALTTEFTQFTEGRRFQQLSL